MGKPKKPIDEAAFEADWKAGMTTYAMSLKYGFSPSSVMHRAKTLGLKPRRVTSRELDALTGGMWVKDANGVKRWVKDDDL